MTGRDTTTMRAFTRARDHRRGRRPDHRRVRVAEPSPTCSGARSACSWWSTPPIPWRCSFAIPEPPEGETIDPDTVEIDDQPGNGGPLASFHQVTGPGACEPAAFYIQADMIFLCPEACATVQGDPGAQLDVRFGCDVGFEPAG